jgi:hypothetical protein
MLSAIKETVSKVYSLVADTSPQLLPILSAIKETVSTDLDFGSRHIATSPRLLPMLSAIKETVSKGYHSAADTLPPLPDSSR